MNKHYIGYGVCVAILVILFFGWKAAHDQKLRMEGDIRVHEQQEKDGQKQISANAATVTTAQGTINNAKASNTELDKKQKEHDNQILNQLNSKPDTSAVLKMIHDALPGVTVTQGKDAQGNATLEVADTQETRDAINKKDADFKSCRFDLDTCRQKQLNFESIIAAQGVQITALSNTVAIQKESINTLQGDLKHATQFGKGGNIWARTGRALFPAGCGAVAAGLSSQANMKGKQVAIATGAAALTCWAIKH